MQELAAKKIDSLKMNVLTYQAVKLKAELEYIIHWFFVIIYIHDDIRLVMIQNLIIDIYLFKADFFYYIEFFVY